MVELVNITKSYPLGDTSIEILHGITLTIRDKELVGILGSSGSGKSTLMHMIGLLDTPTTGSIRVDGKDISKLSDDDLSIMRNRAIGFVFQQFNLIEKLTVLENILLPTLYTRTPLAYDPKAKATEILDYMGLGNRKDYYPNKLSGGQQQRTAIARALVMNPKLILADEPTGNLDTKTGDDILNLLEKLNRELGVTVIIVTHEKDVAKRTNRQFFIRDGSLVKKYL